MDLVYICGGAAVLYVAGVASVSLYRCIVCAPEEKQEEEEEARHIVLITGQEGAGKDTLANLLVENYGYTRYAFADPLRLFGTHLLAYMWPGEPVGLHWFLDRRTKDCPIGDIRETLRRHPDFFERPELSIVPCAHGTQETPRGLIKFVAHTQRTIHGDDFYAAALVRSICTRRAVISDWREAVEIDTVRAAFPGARISRICIAPATSPRCALKVDHVAVNVFDRTTGDQLLQQVAHLF